MSNSLVSEIVNLYKFPEKFFKTHPNEEISLGSLYGNSLKLLFILFKHQLADMVDTTRADYQKFAENYYNLFHDIFISEIFSKIETSKSDDEKSKLLSRYIKEFKKIINRLVLPDNENLLRILGGEVASAGLCDYLTLLIFAKMQKQEVKFEILCSAEGLQFITAIETQKLIGDVELPNSLKSLLILLQRKVIDIAEIERLYTEVYLPHLKLLSYTLTDANKQITIYSNTAIDIETIKNIAQKLQVAFCDDSALDLAKSIDLINEKYQQKLKEGKAHTLLPILTKMEHKELKRDYHYKSYKVNFVYADNDGKYSKDNIFNLYNKLGQDYQPRSSNYTAVNANTINLEESLDEEDSEIQESKEGASCVGKLVHQVSSIVEAVTPFTATTFSMLWPTPTPCSAKSFNFFKIPLAKTQGQTIDEECSEKKAP